jgi:hypothetical protein
MCAGFERSFDIAMPLRTSARKRRISTTIGVAIGDGREAPRLPHVHAATDAWEITSACPIEDVLTLDVDAVLDKVLPGRLGFYVYPVDAVLCCKNEHGNIRDTTTTDLDRTMRSERVCVDEADLVFHHLTVSAPVHAEEEDEDETMEEEDVLADESEDDQAEDEVAVEPDGQEVWDDSDADD